MFLQIIYINVSCQPREDPLGKSWVQPPAEIQRKIESTQMYDVQRSNSMKIKWDHIQSSKIH